MNKETFITLQKEDITSLDNPTYNAILNLFDEYIPAGADIPNNKSVDGMYKYMYAYANKNKINNSYCIDPFDGFKKLMFEYLEIKPGDIDTKKDIDISLEDIFS